jgi:hypothetical protein
MYLGLSREHLQDSLYIEVLCKEQRIALEAARAIGFAL